jgi:hypothetical protein
VARRFGEPYVARNHRAIDLLFEKLAHVASNLLTEVGALVVHRQDHAFDVEGCVEHGAYAAKRRDQIGKSFERKVFAVKRNQHGVGRHKRVEREQAERRRTVEDDEAVARAQRLEKHAQPTVARRHRNELDLRAGEITCRRNERQVFDRGRQEEAIDVGRRILAGQCLVDGGARLRLPFEANAAGRIALRVDVNQQCWVTGCGQARSDVDGSGRFADAALLVCDRYNLCLQHLSRCGSGAG